MRERKRRLSDYVHKNVNSCLSEGLNTRYKTWKINVSENIHIQNGKWHNLDYYSKRCVPGVQN